MGFDDDLKTIVGNLMEQKEKLDVIPIIGIGGLGKTTLAKMVFAEERVLSEFPMRIWISVSHNFNIRHAFLEILKLFTSQDMSGLSDQELTKIARECLEKEKFLVVLDDLWNLDDWKAIQTILPGSGAKGKVLITSRSYEIGVRANVNREPHVLCFLQPDESWKLLQLKLFGNLGACPQELEGIGKIIASKCGGLPLQIVLVGGILAGQLRSSQALSPIKDEWQKVSENLNLFLHKGTSMQDYVELTYNRLSDDLRLCFLYLGVFPNDYEISAWTLIRLWIAEGFIKPKKRESLEETARQILDDLISRGLLMADKISPTGEVKTCHVHDIIHDFCIYKAKQQNFFLEIERSQGGVLDPPVSELQNSRRVCVHSNANAVLSKVPDIARVRSFLCFDKSPSLLDPKDISAILDAINLLKVLDSKSITFSEIPREISKLIHLRYVTLSVDDLNILPEPISELWNLQTLLVQTNTRLIEMKANIWRLFQLRHFKTNAVIVLSPNGKGTAGENLQTLNRLSPQSCTTDVFERARNLKELGIQGNLTTFSQIICLEKMSHLEKLKLAHDPLDGIASENPLPGLRESNFFPPNLKKLSLSNTFLEWKHMFTLAKIRSLEVLKLRNNAFTGIYWGVKDYSFLRLQFLLMSDMDLVHWETSTNSFPNLRYLMIRNCKNLNEIPTALGTNLERLDLEHLGKSAVRSARKIAELKELVETKSEFLFKLSIT